MDTKTTLISKLVIIAAFLVLPSFSGTSLAFTQLAFGWNFTAAGDWGCTSHSAETAERMRLLGPERVLALGDLSYESTADCWLDIIENENLQWPKMKIAIGNHDDDSSALLNQYLNAHDMAKQYRSFQYENAHFIVLSTQLITSSAQATWAQSELQTAASDPDIDWIIVFMHKPMYSSASNHPAEATMRDTYHPMFDQYGVDLVLYGHNHNYERSKPIAYDNVGNPKTPIVTDEATNDYTDPEGAIFATVGTGGASLYAWEGKYYYIVKQQDDYRGFLDVTINGNELSAKYFTIRYNPDQLIVEDRFTITK